MAFWYDKAIFYHMYPLGMSGAPFRNEKGDIVNRFWELEEWILHIKEIGCNAIYIGPLFEASTHGYDTTDYKMVDRRLGDNNSFKRFVSQCHIENIKVVVDGVFNHTGREFFAFKDLMEKGHNSEYKDWYKGVNFGGRSPLGDNFTYDAWRGHFELANLNLKNQVVKNYLLDVIKFWVDTFDIDGIRLDCADSLDFDFMKEMRSFTANLKKDFWLMGEVIHGDYSRWANADTLHATTNYELHKGIYSGHNDHNYFEIAHTVRREFDAQGGIYRNTRLYSFVDNHDVERISSKLKKQEHLIPVHVLLYTLPGIPSIYYGSEWGIKGVKENGRDEPLRPAISLKDIKNDNVELTKTITKLAKIKSENDELSYGAYKELLLTNRQYAFARIYNNSAIIIAVNNDDKECELTINLPVSGSEAVQLLNNNSFKLDGNKLIIKVSPNSGEIIKIM